MDVARETLVPSTASAIGGSRIAFEIDTALYSADAIFRAAYRFTDRCYIHLARRPEEPSLVVVTLTAKRPDAELRPIIGELCNELIDQQIRLDLARETGPLRELIVAQAFAEGNLLDAQRDEGDYEEDPLGIGRVR
jgi:His-Xaa-Ser system protein HxsD